MADKSGETKKGPPKSPKTPKEPVRKWRNRIVGHGEEDPTQLLANPRNWRIHPKQQQDALVGVLAEVGWVQDVIVNQRTGFVVDGHARVALAITAGERVPVVYVDLSEEEERLILATLDPLSAMAVQDKDLLGSLLADLEVTNDAVKAMLAALVGNQPKEGLTGPDAAPDVPVAPVSRPGDVWLLGDHRVLCGDSTDPDSVSRLMGGMKADMVFTDPPYGVNYDGGTTVREKLAGDETTALYDPCCRIAAQFSTPSAALYLWHAGVKGIAAAAAAAAAGYQIRCELIWNKNLAQFGSLSSQYKQKHEPCYYCFKKGHAPAWYGPTNEITVWDCNRSSKNEFHPTQKPVELSERAIGNSSKTGDVVLDLFGGSGSTLIGCERTGRRAFLLELSPGYVDVIVTRWEQFTGKVAKLEADGVGYEEAKRGRRQGAEDALKEEAVQAAKPGPR